jgi:hypothetical protein
LSKVEVPRVGAVEKGNVANDICAEEIIGSEGPSSVVPSV